MTFIIAIIIVGVVYSAYLPLWRNIAAPATFYLERNPEKREAYEILLGDNVGTKLATSFLVSVVLGGVPIAIAAWLFAQYGFGYCISFFVGVGFAGIEALVPIISNTLMSILWRK